MSYFSTNELTFSFQERTPPSHAHFPDSSGSSGCDSRRASHGRGQVCFVRRRFQSRSEDRPQPLRPVRRTSRSWSLRRDLGGTGFRDPQHPRHSQRRRCRAESHKGAECSLARRLLSRTSITGAKASAARSAGDASIPTGAGSSNRTPSAPTNSWTFSSRSAPRRTLSVNVGSGTPQEAAEWLEYMTAAQPTTLAKERAANGHPDPYKVELSWHRQ